MTADPRCGTTAGYQAHGDAGLPPCQPCRDAHAEWQRRYRTRMYLARGPMLIDPTGTRRRLHALVRMGWTFRHIGERLGITEQGARSLTYSASTRRDTAARVMALYDELWDKPGPSKRSAEFARKQGWQLPLVWDDDTIDDPKARPSRMVDCRPAFDEIAIQRAMRGSEVHLRPVERAEAVRRLTDLGLSAAQIADRLTVAPRSVTRHRSAARRDTDVA